MSKIKIFGLVVTIVSFLPAMAALGQTVVNLDINGNNGPTYSGTAAAPDPGTFWNVLNRAQSDTSGSTGTLTASDGSTATPVTFSFSNSTGTFNNLQTGGFVAQNLMADYAFTFSATVASFSISSLPPGVPYELYLYSMNGWNNNATTLFTVGTPQTATNSPATFNSLVLGGNYVLYTGVVPLSGSISGTFNDAAANGSAFNGFQLVYPEPSAISLIGCSLLGMLRRRRH